MVQLDTVAWYELGTNWVQFLRIYIQLSYYTLSNIPSSKLCVPDKELSWTFSVSGRWAKMTQKFVRFPRSCKHNLEVLSVLNLTHPIEMERRWDEARMKCSYQRRPSDRENDGLGGAYHLEDHRSL